ncbi:MAG: hypothetical protein B6D64_12045 [Bacteroidetes bacterium 4484_276]|nr:MAG: hypothetical protein B6D64_12045 [Bacteroidetes bacterium 4484_276]
MNRTLTKKILLVVIAVFIANQYYSCKKIDVVREVMVKTLDAGDVATTYATLKGDVIDLGEGDITRIGFCYSLSNNPTMADDKIFLPGIPNEIGIYGAPVAGLDQNTTYYFRTFAEEGNTGTVSYGSASSFTTKEVDIKTLDAINVAETSATLGGEIINLFGASVSSYGFVYSLSDNPTIDDFKKIAGNNPSIGIYSAGIVGLDQNTTYYFRAFTEEGNGGYVSYGNTKSFTSLENINLPVVATLQVFNITETEATCSGNVTNQGGSNVTVRGFCIGQQHNPTINDVTSENGSGLGEFIHQFSGLAPGNTYFVRSYAENSYGVAYGNEISFFTGGPKWLHYDNGENHDGIGLNEGGDFDVAIKFNPAQLQGYDGWKVTKFRFFPRSGLPTTYSIEIYTGPDGTNLEYLQDVLFVTANEWNEVVLDDPFTIDASHALYPGYWVQEQSPGDFPAGVDEGPAFTGQGDLISTDGAPWQALSIINPALDFNWNLQIFISNASGEEKLLNTVIKDDPHQKGENTKPLQVSSSNQSNR